MAYEKTMHIARLGEPCEIEVEGERFFARWLGAVATFEMGAAGRECSALDELETQSHELKPLQVPAYWYEGEGDEEHYVVKDHYGNLCFPVPISAVIQAIEEDLAEGDPDDFLFTIPSALAFLKSLPEAVRKSHVAIFRGH